MSNSNSPEYRTIIQCTSELTTALKNDLVTLAGELLAAGLIADDNAAALTNQFISEAHRAAQLMGFVRNRVSLDTNNYLAFIQVLQQRRDEHKNILEILDRKYRELGGRRTYHMEICHTRSEPTLPNAESAVMKINRSASTPSGAKLCEMVFCPNMCNEDFMAFLKGKGLTEPDCKKLSGNGVVPQVFVDLSDEDLAELQITLGGKKVIRKAISMIKGSSSAGIVPTNGHRTDSPTTAAQSTCTTSANTTLKVRNDGPLSQCLGIDDLGKVFGAVRDARSKWYNVGLALSVSVSDLDAINSRHRGDPDDCLRETLSVFLRRSTPEPTWTQVADAMASHAVGFQYLVKRLPTQN